MPDVGAPQRDSQKFAVFTSWEKMNTRLAREALPENQLAWCENLQPVGQNNLVPVPAANPSLTTLSNETVNLQYFANLTSQPAGPAATITDYLIVFTSAGGAIAINLANGAQTTIAKDGTFSATPDMTVYASQRILIADPIAGYCTWDGYAFVATGGVSPNIIVTNGGSGYTSVPTVTISGGSGSGATAHAIVGGAFLSSVHMDNGGSGYTSPPDVAITGGFGQGVKAHALLTPTVVASIVLDNPGAAYTAQPTVTVVGGSGTGCTADALLTPTTVNSVIVTTAGSGYTSVPTVAFVGGGGTGAVAHAAMGGDVDTIVLDNGGSGYTSPPSIAFVSSDSGTGALAHALLAPTTVASFVVDVGGTGYRVPPVVTITDGGGSGATATCVFLPSILEFITVTNGGAGYTHAPTVSFSGGGGSGAVAHAVISSGIVTSVVVDFGGSGYSTLPTIHFTGGGGVGAAAIARLEATSVASVVVTNAGSGYTHLPTVTITPVVGGVGTGARAHAVLQATSVASLVLDAGGASYSGAPTVTFTGGGGSGAAAHATANLDTVAAVVIDNAGSGYTTVPLISFSGGGGTGAVAHAVLTATTVGSINIDAAGSGFNDVPTVKFSGGGGGSGAAAHAVLFPTSVGLVVVDSQGSGFLITDTPIVTFSGGGGTGAAAHVVIGEGGSGFVAKIVLDNGGFGYKQGDTLTVTISGGGGTGATATAQVWPRIECTTVAVFAGRVWTADVRVLRFTGTAGYDDVNPTNAAGSVTFADADLSHTITALRTLNNYLFIFGDQSVRQIGAITVSAANTTLFTPFVLASDIGTNFPQTILSYNRLVLFANENGVYAIFGASVEKISDDLDGIFAGPTSQGTVHSHIDFSLTPQAALVDLRNIHCYLLLVRYVDPVAGPRSIALAFQEKTWFVISQGQLVSIAAVFLGSARQWEVFGSTGSDITMLLQDDTTAVPVKLQTALTSHQNPIQAKQALRAGVAAVTNSDQSLSLLIESEYTNRTYTLVLPVNVFWINNVGAVVNFVNSSGSFVQWTVPGGFRFPYTMVDGLGKFLGCTLTANMVNSVVTMLAIEYQDRALWGRPA